VTRFAVKVVDREDMDSNGLTEADVRREARTLEGLRHTNIIRYYGVESSEEEMGIIM
jgi:serine/threonine protein kinase